MRDNNCVLQFQLFSARNGSAAVKQPRNDHAMDEAGGMQSLDSIEAIG